MGTSLATLNGRPLKIPSMAKKRTGGQHKTPRKPMQIPVTWLRLARKMAAKRKQPTLWFVLHLIQQAAEQEDEEVPPGPWDDEADAPE